MVKDGFKYPLKTLDQMPRDPADCRPIFSLASAGATWPIKFWKSQRLEISEPFCYPPWFQHYHWDFTFPYNQHELLLLLLNVASCPFSVPLWEKLGFISPSSIHWGGWTTQFSSPLSCLSFPGGSRAELSSPSPWLPHSQWKHTASSPIMLTAPTLAGPLCWPSGWEHHSSVTLLVMERPVQSNSPPLSAGLTHHLHPGMFLSLPEASSRAQGWVWSEQGRSCPANPGSEHRQSPGLASLTCSQADRQQNREHMCKAQGEVPGPAPDTHGTDRHSPSCSRVCPS